VLNFFKNKNENPPKTQPSAAVARKMYEALQEKLPAASVEYCFKLWQENPFSFKISRTRNSCLGNYTFRDGTHKITVNHDLNQYAFLLTYIHEIAHQHTWINKAGRRKKILPHGIEWKTNFQRLMQPLLSPEIYPEKILKPLTVYMSNPMASSVSYTPLQEALQSFNTHVEEGILLGQLPDNKWFEFRNVVYQKLEMRRTRALCLEKKSKRKYTIAAIARVKVIE
jgi:hypothetical protein